MHLHRGPCPENISVVGTMATALVIVVANCPAIALSMVSFRQQCCFEQECSGRPVRYNADW